MALTLDWSRRFTLIEVVLTIVRAATVRAVSRSTTPCCTSHCGA